MNLIGHYLCASDAGRDFRLGSVLPDLLGLYERRLRPRALTDLWAAEPSSATAAFHELLAGMAFHHEVDVHFHRAPLFTEASTGLRLALAEASDTPGLKRFLPAHVLTELFLDHIALQHDPGLADRFNEDLAAECASMAAMVALHPLGDEADFATFLRGIVSNRFVEGYRSLENILGRMNRILPRFGQRVLEPAEHQAVAEWFRDAAPIMERRLNDFTAKMVSLGSQPDAWARAREDGNAKGGTITGSGSGRESQGISETGKNKSGTKGSKARFPDPASQPV